jgi:hypothetical protein
MIYFILFVTLVLHIVYLINGNEQIKPPYPRFM